MKIMDYRALISFIPQIFKNFEENTEISKFQGFVGSSNFHLWRTLYVTFFTAQMKYHKKGMYKIYLKV